MKRILVTGSNGVVGSQLVTELLFRGHVVFECDISHAENERGFSVSDEGANQYSRCDVSDYRQLWRLFANAGPFDFVYHAAAEFGRWNGEDYYENLWRTNVIGTKHIIRLQERSHFGLIHFSSSEVYGDYTGIMSEDVMDSVEVKQLNDYAMTKWVNEMQIRNSAAQFGTQSVVVRLFNTYGPGEFYSPYRSVNCRFLYCALTKTPWKVFRGHTRTSTFLPDTVATLANIVDNFKPGETYNIGGDQRHTIEELSDTVLRVTGADPKLVSHAPSEMMTTKEKRVDVSKSVADLKHTNTVTLEEGLARTAKWMKGVYGI